MVSVIITTFNRAHFLRRAIKSVLNQTYKDIEIIVVDDCSNDNTEKVVSECIRNNKNIKYIRHNKNKGLSAARNTGIKHSTGKYISFLDDDDELLPKKIQKQVEFLEKHKNIDAIYCGYIRKSDNFEQVYIPKKITNFLKESLILPLSVIHSLLIKKECFSKIGLFDENLKYFEDWDLWIRLSAEVNLAIINEPLVVYHIHGAQMMLSNLNEKINANHYILAKHKNLFKRYKKSLFWNYRRLLTRYSLMDDYRNAFKYAIKAIKLNPLSLTTYVHLFLMLTNKKLQRRLIYKFGLRKIGNYYIL